jgi:hypothetical protein
MVDLNGHDAGNGGYSQGRPTTHRDLLYSERWRFCNSYLLKNPWHEADEPGFRYLLRYSIAPNVLIRFANVQY